MSPGARAIRPKWICETGVAGDTAGAQEFDEYVRTLQERRAARGPIAGDEQTAAAAGTPEEGRPGDMNEEAERDEIEISEDEEDDEAECGTRRVKKMQDPKLPTQAEVKEHQLTHLPFRSWCHHCVKGRGKEMPHEREKADEEQTLPEYHMDYAFPGDEEGNKLTTLVIIERHSKMKKAVVVPSKGSTGRFAARKVLDLIQECGDKNSTVIVKSDQEPAIKFLVDDVCMSRTGAKTIVEMSPVGSKGSNGVVERAVQAVEEYLRTMKSQLDERYKVRIDTKHPIVTWMCEYSMYLLNRLEVSKDGKTAYERCRGKKARVLGFEFGEKVLWKVRPKTGHLQKLNVRWSHGLFLGIRSASGEVIVTDESGKVNYTRTARRIPEEQRWQQEDLEWVRVVPWNKGADDKDADGEVPEFDFKHGPGTRLTEGEMEEIKSQVPPKITHRAHLRKADFEKHGFTDRCGGCSAILRGLNIQPHADHCRRRMEQLLEADVRVRNAKVRLEERSKRRQQEGREGNERLKDIEEAAMTEDDPVKLMALFEEYREEYLKERDTDEEKGPKKAKRQATQDESMGEPRVEVRGKRGLEDIEEEAFREMTKLDGLYQEYMMEAKRQKGEDTAMRETATSSTSTPNYMETQLEEVKQSMDTNMIIQSELGEYAWDEVNNMELPMKDVREARLEEMTYMKGKTFKVVKRSEAYERTGKAPISTKWVDTDKSHGVGEMKVRSRWVARDFKSKGERDREDLFCATPPLELLRFLISRQATRRADGRGRKTLFIDVRKAHLIPECKEDVYVDLPEEAGAQADECGKLLYWLYGCRRAGQAWEDHYSLVLMQSGFVRAVSSPVAFYHPSREIWVVVHGDDFVVTGVDEELDFVLALLQEHYEIKNRGRLGSGPKDVKEIDILGRKLQLHEWGISWEADPRHRKILMEHFGLDDESKALGKKRVQGRSQHGGGGAIVRRGTEYLPSTSCESKLLGPGQPLRAVLGEGSVSEDVPPDTAGLPEIEETSTVSGRTKECKVGLRVAVRSPGPEPTGVRGQRLGRMH